MPTLKPVSRLFDLASESAFRLFVENPAANLEQIRNYALSNLHCGIREELIARANTNIATFLHIMDYLADSSIKELVFPQRCYFNIKSVDLTRILGNKFFSRINDLNVIGLRNLIVKYPRTIIDREAVPSTIPEGTLDGLHLSFKAGLATNLRVLTLHNLANNNTMALLGRHAEHLSHLDITSSWMVDDYGICDLLLLNSCVFISAHRQALELSEPMAIHALSLFPQSQRNRTCKTLIKVKLQYTNTSSISDLLLLMFATNLQSFGGFLYSRNIGDAILGVQTRANAPKALALTELWEMEKLSMLTNYLPNLQLLYTRMSSLPHGPGILPPLRHLKVDFDFAYLEPDCLKFLQFNGTTLTKLHLIDQIYKLNLNEIGKYCPNLEVLKAGVYVDNTKVLMPKLKQANVNTGCANTFLWLMKNAPNILVLEIFFCSDDDDLQNACDDNLINQIINENPPSLQSIVHLNLIMTIHSEVQAGAAYQSQLSINSATALCAASKSLKSLGELQSWSGVYKKDLAKLVNKILKCNWDIRIRYGKSIFPDCRIGSDPKEYYMSPLGVR